MIQLTNKVKTEAFIEALIALYEENIGGLDPELRLSIVADNDWTYQKWIIKIWFTSKVFHANDPTTGREEERDYASIEVPMLLSIGELERVVNKTLDELKEVQQAA